MFAPKVTRVYTQNLEFLWEFESTSQAAKMLGVGCGNIGTSCKYPYPLYLGLNWRYAEDDDIYAHADKSHQDFSRLSVLCKTSRHGTPRCAVRQYTAEGVCLGEYRTASEAARAVGLPRGSGILACCKGDQHLSGGFKWRYAEDDDEAKRLKSEATAERFLDGFDVQEFEGEIWKTVDMCDKYGVRPYEVSNFGRVRKLGRYDSLGQYEPARLIAQMRDHNGGVTVRITNGASGSSRVAVSRLVATAFIPNPDGLVLVRHLDRNSMNNRVENLAWCSLSDLISLNGMTEKAAVINSKAIRQYSPDGVLISEYTSASDAERRTGLSADNIRWGCQRGSKSGLASGYVWRYASDDDLYELSEPERRVAIDNLCVSIRHKK